MVSRSSPSIPLQRGRKSFVSVLNHPFGRVLFPQSKEEEDFVSLLEEGLRVVTIFLFYIIPLSPPSKGEEDFVSLLEEGLRVVTIFLFYIIPLSPPSKGEEDFVSLLEEGSPRRKGW